MSAPLFTSQAIDAMPGFMRLNPGVECAFETVSTDSRALPSAALFVPLRGVRFDGHAFVAEAVAQGARGVLTEREMDVPPNVAVWRVADTLRALGDLGRAYRDRFRIPTLALTGTSGKTTVKELVRANFAKRSILVNEGNLNNLIGVPLTLFNLRPQHEFAAIEIGMNQFGEIERLTEIVNPTVGLINNVGPGHLEGVGSIEGVLQAKTELARTMRADAPIILNADDPLLRRFGTGTQRRVVWFGLQAGADVSASDVADRGLEGQRFTLRTPLGSAPVELRLPGEHNLRNALAAAAASMLLGLPFEEIVEGIAAATPFRMRNELVQGKNGSRIVSDCYNANPASMREALRLLRTERKGGRIGAVLGDMLELGEHAERYHAELGALIAEIGADRVWFVGRWAAVISAAAGGAVVGGQTAQDIVDDVTAWVREGDTLLVKGSRGMKLDQVVAALTQAEARH
jgi:UDP-N-acetylmuramoyl-tripeptide--D-alanyl-D-alanine ligase